MLSTLAGLNSRALFSKALLKCVSSTSPSAQIVSRRWFASSLLRKSGNVKAAASKSRRLFSTEGAAEETKAAEGVKTASESANAAAEEAAGPKSYRTVKEGQEIMAVKVVRNAKKASKSALYLFLAGTAVITAFTIGKELFTTNMSGTAVFSDAVKIVLNDPDVNRYLGGNVKAYGKDFGGRRAGRRNWIENYIYEDEDGMQHCRIKFNVEGKRGKGEVFAEKSKEMGHGAFHYLVFVDGNTGAAVGIIDNRTYLPIEKQRELVIEKLHSIKAVLYGMRSQEDTNKQLAILGPLKDKVEFVDCETRPQVCEQSQIAAVPTWNIRGKRFVGVKQLDDLEVLCHKEIKK